MVKTSKSDKKYQKRFLKNDKTKTDFFEVSLIKISKTRGWEIRRQTMRYQYEIEHILKKNPQPENGAM